MNRSLFIFGANGIPRYAANMHPSLHSLRRIQRSSQQSAGSVGVRGIETREGTNSSLTSLTACDVVQGVQSRRKRRFATELAETGNFEDAMSSSLRWTPAPSLSRTGLPLSPALGSSGLADCREGARRCRATAWFKLGGLRAIRACAASQSTFLSPTKTSRELGSPEHRRRQR
jgi:hypothetical protein